MGDAANRLDSKLERRRSHAKVVGSIPIGSTNFLATSADCRYLRPSWCAKYESKNFSCSQLGLFLFLGWLRGPEAR